MRPDVFLMNWGHHTTYTWQKGLGRQQYESITRAVKQLRAENYKTLLYWKTTTPIYSCEDRLPLDRARSEGAGPPCRLKVMKESDGQNPIKLGNKLVQDRILEQFDAQHYVKLLHTELRRHRHKHHSKLRIQTATCGGNNNNSNGHVSSSSSSSSSSQHYCCSSGSGAGSRDNSQQQECHHQNPMGWDSLHYFCWVNTELNRALIADYMLKMRNNA